MESDLFWQVFSLHKKGVYNNQSRWTWLTSQHKRKIYIFCAFSRSFSIRLCQSWQMGAVFYLWLHTYKLILVFFKEVLYKPWKVHRVVWKNLPYSGPEGNQTFLGGAAPKESLITRDTSCGQTFPENPEALWRFSAFWIIIVKMRPRVALGYTLNVFRFLPSASLTV